MTEQAQGPAAPPQENPIDNVVLDLKLPVIVVNQILLALSKLPYDQVAGSIVAIRQQGDPQVDAARAALAAPPTSCPSSRPITSIPLTRRKQR